MEHEALALPSPTPGWTIIINPPHQPPQLDKERQ